MEMDLLKRQLDAFVAAHYPAGAKVGEVTGTDGHAGLTYRFTVAGPDGGAAENLFLKVPPKGVKRRQNTDVYRQAPLLRALAARGLPVPEVRFAGDDEDFFEVPYVITAGLPGRILLTWDPHPSFERTPEAMAPLWRQTAAALVEVHKVDWRDALAGWEDPRPLAEEIDRWAPIYAKADDPTWITLAEAVHGLLRETMPDGRPVGLIHGDFQPGNMLFQDGKLVAILDWELSGIGANLLDIGWLLMNADKQAWPDNWSPVHPPPVAELTEIYEAGMGRRFPDIPYYEALALYRLASIACLNVRLHRTGRRPDPMWENFVDAVPVMFGRALRLIEEYR